MNTAKPHFFSSLCKRTADLIISLGLLLLSAPLFLFLALVIFLDDGAPIFFKQYRIGRNGKAFKILKFRTMKKSTPNCATAELKNPQAYITASGRILRKTSLDELPQLLNIVKGEMSLIGPRPLIPEETTVHTLREAYGVYTMRPGITGLAQINGRDLVSDHEKAYYDKEYVQNYSLLKDLGILFKTIIQVLKADGIQEGKQSTRETA